jgi:hypothetical protein
MQANLCAFGLGSRRSWPRSMQYRPSNTGRGNTGEALPGGHFS